MIKQNFYTRQEIVQLIDDNDLLRGEVSRLKSRIEELESRLAKKSETRVVYRTRRPYADLNPCCPIF